MKGLSNVLRNLDKAITKQRKATKAGLFEAGLIIKADSVKETPEDTSNLAGSAFVMVTGLPTDNASPTFIGDDKDKMTNSFSSALTFGKNIVGKDEEKPVGLVGYGAYYALYVHEMPASYNFQNGGPKFLEKSLNKNRKRVLKAIAKHAKI